MYPELSINTSATSSYLPFDEKVLVSGITGFPLSVYKWQYSINNGASWNNVPSSVINSASPGQLRISASDIMGEPQFLSLLENRTNIQFRINNSIKPSNIVTIPLRLSSPHFTGSTFEIENCHGSGDASVTLTFDRSLKPGEKLQVLTNNQVSQNDANIALDAANSYTVRGLAAGTYTFTLLGSYNAYQTYTGDPAHRVQVVIPERPAMAHAFTKKEISCHDGQDGQITITATGGTGNYTANLYMNGNSSPFRSVQFTASSPAVFKRLPAGQYQARVTDSNGCVALTSGGSELVHAIELLQPTAPVSATVEWLKNPLANGSSDGEAVIRISGGTRMATGYTVVCTRSGGGTIPTGALVPNGADFLCTVANLPHGDYLFRVEDANFPALEPQDKNAPCGCMSTVNFEMYQPQPLGVQIERVDSVSCHGESNGRLVAHGTGGIRLTGGMHYTYTWYDMSSGQPVGITQSNDSILSGIPAGSYQVIITDANNIALSSAIYALTQPEPVSVLLETKDISCQDGQDGRLAVTAAGGSGKYKAEIYKSGNNTPLETVEFAASAQGVFQRLKSGDYLVKVFDTNGCVARAPDGSELVHTVTLIQPPAPVLATVELLENPLANGSSDGKAVIRISGGTQMVQGYTVSCTRSDGITFPTGTLVADGAEWLCTVDNLPHGDYLFRVEDANFPTLEPQDKNAPCGCMSTVNFELNQPQQLEITIEESNPVSCNGESNASLVAHGKGGIRITGGLPYIYTWYDASSGQPVEITQANDSILQGIPAGSYQVKITDANHITLWSETYILSQPDSLRILFETEDAGCAGSSGKVKAVVTGGTAPYSYQWNKEGETGDAIAAVTAGDYIVRVTDQRGCTLAATVEITAPGGLRIDTLITHPSCYNGADGAIELVLSGATPPYTVRWKDDNSSALVRNQLSAGFYEVVITDVNNCESTYSFTLREPEGMTVVLGEDFTLCKGHSRIVTATCNHEEVTYEWYKDGQKMDFSTAGISVDKEGTYTVVATNGKGCTATAAIAVGMGNDTFEIDFTVPTAVVPGSEIHAVNIGTIAADKTVWTLPEEAKVIKLADTEAVFAIDKKGSYAISMEGFKGDCSTVLTKTLTVSDDGEASLPDDKNPLIKQFLVTPNPTEGAFKVLVELNQKENFTMMLYSPAGVLMDKKEAVQVQSSVFEYDIRGELTGAFMLHLETRSDKAAIKIVKEVKK